MKNKSLSHREREVLLYLSSGLTEPEVADKLSISPDTVHTHRKNIYKKLKTNCMIIAMGKALYLQYITPQDWFFIMATCHLL